MAGLFFDKFRQGRSDLKKPPLPYAHWCTANLHFGFSHKILQIRYAGLPVFDTHLKGITF